jgi:hypothetical protein
VDKRELILGGGDEEDDAAIRVGMAEAKVIEDNKRFLTIQVSLVSCGYDKLLVH